MTSPNIISLKEMLEDIKDPRAKRGIRHRLSDVILIMIFATLCGYDTSTDIEIYGEEHAEDFEKYFGIKKTPSHDTISRILKMIDFTALYELFSSFLQVFYPSTYIKYAGKTVTHIDGKAVKAATKKSEGQNTVYLLNSYVEGETISLKSLEIGDKENEISAIPNYLDFLGIKDSIITIDAIGCNTKIIKSILDHKCNFFLIVKENQKMLLNAINREIELLEKENKFEKLETCSLLNKDHGRIEAMKATIISDTEFIFDSNLNEIFNNIGKICVIDKTTTSKINGESKTTKTRTICITDLTELSVNEMLEIKLSHWNIEASHWILDVQYKEDYSTSRSGNSIVNLSLLRKFGMRMRNSSEEFSKKPIKRMFMRNVSHFENIIEMLCIDE